MSSAMTQSTPVLRRATPADSVAACALVAATLAEFGLKPDPAGTDADLADFEANYFARGGDFVVLIDGRGVLVGTCGLYPLEGTEAPRTVELRKMYLSPSLRGFGQGRRLLEWALARARELGFRRMTLETASALKDAIALYERNGFKPDGGGSHSCRCDLAYARDL
ncbi:MAG: N-acetyltransferase [Opitutus sp.]|nr:N-acetyltransferase [Opitutus sp.]